MRIGLATYAFPDLDVVSATKMCLRYSDHVHISPIYPKVTHEQIDELLVLQKWFGADFSIHAPFPSRGKMADLGTKEGLEHFKQSIAFAHRLGGDRIIFHASHREKKDDIVEHARELVPLCEEAGMVGCFENRPELDTYLSAKEEMLEFCKAVPGAQLCFDTSHYYMNHDGVQDLFNTIDAVAEHIGAVHMVDTYKGQDAHLLPGFGEISVFYLVKSLMKIPNLKNVPFIFEDQEPFNYFQGVMNLRHAFVSRKGMIDRHCKETDGM